jgi:hypothetical protein
MKKILFSVLLAACAGSALAQTDATNVSNGKARAEADAAAMSPAEKAADHHCLRYTGSHLRSRAPAKTDKASDCANAVGSAYTREDIERTGTVTTGDALRHLDPSIH